MYSLLVLGLIPGTNIQINFSDWLIVAGILFCIGALAYLRIHQRAANLFRTYNRALLSLASRRHSA